MAAAIGQQHQLDTSLESIPDFLNFTRDLFDDMVYSWSHLLFPFHSRPLLESAWDNLRSELENARDAIDGDSERLERVGLTSGQLALKLHGLRTAAEEFVMRGTVRILQRVLGWINTILGSLVTAFPGLEPIKEFKEVMERLIGESQP